jgi:N-acetylmuramoyl-L-alanine amidase
MKKTLACAAISLGLLAAEPAVSQDLETIGSGFRSDWVEDAAQHGIRFFDCSVVSDERRKLTAEYSAMHYGLETWKLDEPRMIVLHGTATSTLSSTVRIFQPLTLGGSRPELAGAGAVNVSTHFVVGRDGAVCQLLPLDMQGRHAKGVNWTSFGVEMVSKPDLLITESEAEATAWLIDRLVGEFGDTLAHVVAHRDMWKLNDTDFVRTGVDPNYKDRSVDKSDPYADDFDKVRVEVEGDFPEALQGLDSFQRL